MTAILIRPLTEREKRCLNCRVPGGCHEGHELCRYHNPPEPAPISVITPAEQEALCLTTHPTSRPLPNPA